MMTKMDERTEGEQLDTEAVRFQWLARGKERPLRLAKEASSKWATIITSMAAS